MIKIKKNGITCGLLILLVIILIKSVFTYDVDPPNEVVHQHLTKEALEVWKLIPYEIKNHSWHNIRDDLDHFGYQKDEDIIIGSGEEDKAGCIPEGGPNCPYYMHFWQPDEPRGGNYSDGLGYSYEHDSSYIRAKEIFKTKIIPLYIRGEINESYYWLGRVAHLLEDAASSAHTHEDPHPIEDSLEDYTGNTFRNWKGSDYKSQQYNYESPTNMQSFNWAEVEPTDHLAKQHIFGNVHSFSYKLETEVI